MGSFSYKAISSQGKAVQGRVVADRIELASRELRLQGLTLLSLEPAGKGAVRADEDAPGPAVLAVMMFWQ